MRKHSVVNERIKRKYFSYLKEAKRYSEPTIDATAKALNRFEEYTRYRDFKTFHPEQAIAFKKFLTEQRAVQSGNKLSKSTLHTTLTQLKNFFHWLAGQPGYKSRLQYTDSEYFNLSDKDTRVANARREKKAPTLEQIKHVLSAMPNNTEIEQRNRALIAFTLLTGARDSAIASMKLKHVDLLNNSVYQDAREVQTKFSKTFETFFLPVGNEIREIVKTWVEFLRTEKLWGNNDPLFPATAVAYGTSKKFEVAGIAREHWKTASPIRRIFKEAFEYAGLPYFNPHSFRNTLVQLGEKLCMAPEQFKAWSQNLGHEKVLTTFLSYGEVSSQRQGEIIKGLANHDSDTPTITPELISALIKQLEESR